jgi:large subunit ribosomal protein L21
MFAVFATGGKQYRVEQGDVIFVEKLEGEVGAECKFDALLVKKDDGTVAVGAPTVEGASVTAKIAGQVKGRKIVVYKYKAKKNERKKQGHRQPYTKLEITAING